MTMCVCQGGLQLLATPCLCRGARLQDNAAFPEPPLCLGGGVGFLEIERYHGICHLSYQKNERFQEGFVAEGLGPLNPQRITCFPLPIFAILSSVQTEPISHLPLVLPTF